ncbi:hypothetical protein HY489_05840 [Candidatus Woesearchaeota archaeon]|nr:hypothetical protein [Candidatus Woesearchaeota archaeon]
MILDTALQGNQVVLLFIPSEKYNEATIDVAKKFSSKKVCYITLNKTYEHLSQTFTSKNINIKNFFFIDAISKIFKEPATTDPRCQAVTPGNLTELALVISEALTMNFDYIIFDSLTNLLVYQKHSDILKFIMDLCSKVKTSKTKCVLYTMQEHQEIIQRACVMVDSCVNWGK